MAIQTRYKTTHQSAIVIIYCLQPIPVCYNRYIQTKERQYNGRHQSNRKVYHIDRSIRSSMRSHTRLSVIIYCLQPIPVCYNRYIQTKERSLCIK